MSRREFGRIASGAHSASVRYNDLIRCSQSCFVEGSVLETCFVLALVKYKLQCRQKKNMARTCYA
jgi:hypothetical protein